MIFSDVTGVGGGGVNCYIRKGLCFNTRPLNCKEIENMIFHILFPKSKPITVGVFCRPQNQANFMEFFFSFKSEGKWNISSRLF